MTKDVYLYDTPDGGDVTQDLEIRDGLETSVYLSLFGGNAKDDGSQDNPFGWWGNIGETVAARRYVSEAAFLLRTVPPEPKNLRRIEDAAKRDLAWALAGGVTETLAVVVTMPALNTVKMSVFLDGIDPIEFRSSWAIKSEEELSQIVPAPEILVNDGLILSGTGSPNTTLNLALSNGDIISVPISSDGTWSIEPYPLFKGEISTAYITVKSGLSSKGVIVIGVEALLYNGDVFYDGTQTYSGLKA